MPIFVPPTDSDLLTWNLWERSPAICMSFKICVFNKPSREFWCTLKCQNHGARVSLKTPRKRASCHLWREVQDEEQKPERLFHVRIFPHVYVLPALNKNSTIKTCHFDPKWKILLKNWMMGFGLQHDSSKEKTTCWDQGFNAAHRYIYKWPCMVWCSRV